MTGTNRVRITVDYAVVALAVVIVTAGVAVAAHSHNVPTEPQEARTVPQKQAVSDIWNAIDDNMDRLNKTIAYGDVVNAHQIAIDIRDLAIKLDDNATVMPQEKRRLLTELLGRVALHAKKLGWASHARDPERAAPEFAEMEKSLGQIRKLLGETATPGLDEPGKD